jgi:hypothetical protein
MEQFFNHWQKKDKRHIHKKAFEKSELKQHRHETPWKFHGVRQLADSIEFYRMQKFKTIENEAQPTYAYVGSAWFSMVLNFCGWPAKHI